jgi:hypothetical protein
MRRLPQAVLLAVFLAGPASLLAQDNLPRPLASQEDLTFKTAGQNVVAAWDNVYIGPYTADITSGDPTIPGITLYCVDFAHEVNYGQSWTANITNLGPDDADMSDTRLGVGSVDTYRQAAFLASLFTSWTDYTSATYNTAGGPVAYSTKAAVYSGIHAAIWSIMTAGFPSIGGVDNPTLAGQMASYFLGLVAPDTFDYSEWSVVTDVVANGEVGGTQEFVVRTTVTPEPRTYALLLTGLLLMVGVAKLQRRKELPGLA